MSREIKFRVWQKDKKVMMDVKEYDFENKEIWAENITGTWYKDDGLEIMQYTGLKDKNGKEIYEGDIVKGHYYKEGIAYRFIGKVKYIGSKYEICGVKQYIGLATELNSTYEIIGNIYENPELLEEKQ